MQALSLITVITMGTNSYTTVKGEGVFEYEDRKSIFIGTAVPVSTEERALEFISFIKKKYPDARHHVYAYVLRENSIMRFSDDREPQGSAGMPVLDAIRKNGCSDVAIVVIRYFGGTLLGTGGLVRAYSSAAVGALENAQIITYDTYTLMRITVNYSDYGKLTPILADIGFRIDSTDYNENVVLNGRILKEKTEKITILIADTTAGRANVEILEDLFDF